MVGARLGRSGTNGVVTDALRRQNDRGRDCNGRAQNIERRKEAVMPQGVSPKRERQYEHIKESYQERGVSTDEAEERAARTVNKQRAESGETKSSRKKS
jgi:hypothetical protein